MPTPACHTQSIIANLMQTANDKLTLAAASVVATTPLWWEAARRISEVGAMIGPGLAAVYVMSRIVLTWAQIWRTLRAPSAPSD